ncbi:MAG: hypothetical protein ACREGC_00460 [Minisyncoccia bacterium]
MYFLLILFFGSLIGITFMIGKKVLMIQNGEIVPMSENLAKTPYLEEWKNMIIKNAKKQSFVALVLLIRIYVRSSDNLKTKYQKLKIQIKNLLSRKSKNGSTKEREANKFLKMIDEYKRKVKKIKERVKKEENL